MEGAAQFADLQSAYAGDPAVVAGQMFGKPCLKVGGKAFVAHQKDRIAFKLTGAVHAAALAEAAAVLWDPSGMQRPMKEWVALPVAQNGNFRHYAAAAKTYVKG